LNVAATQAHRHTCPRLNHTPGEPSRPSALEHIATHELPQAGPTQTLGTTHRVCAPSATSQSHISCRCLVGTKLHTLLQIRSDPLPSLPNKETKVRAIERSTERGDNHVQPLSVGKRREFPLIIGEDINRMQLCELQELTMAN
jgi:hypothetical protein